MKFPVALEQSNCVIFKIGKFGYWGFCETDESLGETEKICLTVVVKSRTEVDEWYDYLIENKTLSKSSPQEYSKYNIYTCFFLDPSGYTLEIQAFSEESKPHGHDLFLEAI
ncbi:MAG: hypothetical protein ACTSSG_14505 [Candidatus Heimdallarchaeaceae archaeon]